MMPDLEEMADWEALQRFRGLPSDELRIEQLMMTALAASRTSRQNGKDIGEVQKTVLQQNSRIGKVETRIIQIFAVLVFVGAVVPLILAAAQLLRG